MAGRSAKPNTVSTVWHRPDRGARFQGCADRAHREIPAGETQACHLPFRRSRLGHWRLTQTHNIGTDRTTRRAHEHRGKFVKYFQLAAAAALLGSPALAWSADDIESLKRQIQELDQKVRILERKAELDSEGAQARVQSAPKLSVGSDGVSFSSADTNFVLK